MARGLAAATAAGLTPGSRSPLEPAPQPVAPRPARKRRRWSEAEHERRVWEALRAATTLASRLRSAEAHPEHGRWIWLHITLASTPSRNPFSRGQVKLTRAYDHLPDWWPGPPEGLFLEDLRTEMGQRAPSWRPPWTVLLDPDTAWETG